MAVSPQHATLVAATVATLTFDIDFPEIEVTNVDGADIVYFRCGGTAPTVAGAGSYVVHATKGAAVTIRPQTSGPTVVKLISAGTPKVSARGIPAP